ncbi:MAG: hypothetical protein KBF43_09030 [Dermatophilaceae bacterium]|nr:hypothetical protein [Dermatophilaceae bacterium]
MTGSITPVIDTTYARVGVTLSGWLSPTDGPITVKRVHPDTSEWTVRGFGSTSGGAAFAYDYEAPFGQSVTYYAMDGATRVISAPVSIASSKAMLRAPGLPSLDCTILLAKLAPQVFPDPQAVLRPLGRQTAVVLSGGRAAGDLTVVVETHSFAEGSALETILMQKATVLLVRPGTRKPWLYVKVGDATETPFTDWMLSGDGAAGEWALWSLPCTVTDSPAGGIFGDPTATYQKILDTYPTYQALLSAKATYLDVLKGV